MTALTTPVTSRNGTTRSADRHGAAPPRSTPSPLRSPRSRRNTGRIALGLIVLAISALAAVVVFSSAADRVTVIGVARDVPAGKAITESDLRDVSISRGSGLRTIPTQDASKVVGRTAAVGLVAGSLLSPGQLADGPLLPTGTVITGAVLKSGQFPVGLSIGDQVDVVETAAADSSGVGEPVPRGSATVVDLSESGDGQGAVTVSLAVRSESAAAISSAGAAGRLSLVVTPR